MELMYIMKGKEGNVWQYLTVHFRSLSKYRSLYGEIIEKILDVVNIGEHARR